MGVIGVGGDGCGGDCCVEGGGGEAEGVFVCKVRGWGGVNQQPPSFLLCSNLILTLEQIGFAQGTQQKDQQWISLSNRILPGLRP